MASAIPPNNLLILSVLGLGAWWYMRQGQAGGLQVTPRTTSSPFYTTPGSMAGGSTLFGTRPPATGTTAGGGLVPWWQRLMGGNGTVPIAGQSSGYGSASTYRGPPIQVGIGGADARTALNAAERAISDGYTLDPNGMGSDQVGVGGPDARAAIRATEQDYYGTPAGQTDLSGPSRTDQTPNDGFYTDAASGTYTNNDDLIIDPNGWNGGSGLASIATVRQIDAGTLAADQVPISPAPGSDYNPDELFNADFWF